MTTKINRFSIAYVGGLIGIIVPIVAGALYMSSLVATKTQLSEVRNELSIANNETHIALMYLKYPTPIKIDDWTMEDIAKYNSLIETKKDLEKLRKELSGIPSGLPQ